MILLLTQNTYAAILSINSATSFTNTSGGFTGSGLGSFSIPGTFSVETTATEISFVDIDVDATPGNALGTFIPEFTLSYDGLNFSSSG